MTARQDEISPGSSGRTAQRRRTREAILAATKRLLADGHTPSIDEIAVDADVSRRTIYMYFPTLDQLLVDATSGLLSERTIEALLGSPDFETDPLDRVDEFAKSLLGMAPQALPLARTIMRLTVDTELPADAARRGYRRIEWLGRVLEPLRGQLRDEQFERLTSALAVVLGWEAMIVLQDTRGLDSADEERVIRWMARTLVTAILDEPAS
ncbi:MAG TPA: TetR/AcrR family transcriptional regulator [Jatrophihabitans sp.]|jgi:AcrR family transcriptional regulator|nr:TetR/AcrR family transcriptional regulator [Jatrophihabitans sp.]